MVADGCAGVRHGGVRGKVRGKLLAILVMAHLFLVTPCFGGEFHNALSLQGFTGLLNTPNAAVTDEGSVAFLFSNQKEDKWRTRVPYEESYIASVGLFSFAEIAARLTEAPGTARDLSANAKIRLPLGSWAYFLPDIAVGMQDMGGGARNLQTKYAVATKEWWRLRFSLGYGTGPDRMDGPFGGVEVKAFDWLYLIGEHDTKEKNIGIRLVTPELFGMPMNLQLTVKTSIDHRFGNPEFGFGLQIPLGFDDRPKGRPAAPRDKADATEPSAAQTTANNAEGKAPLPDMAGGTTRAAGAGAHAASSGSVGQQAPQGGHAASGAGAVALPDGDRVLRSLQAKLLAEGFQNVRVGADMGKKLLVVEYENSRYNRNELDGLGIAAGLVAETASSGFETLRLILVKKGIRILQVSAPLTALQDFFYDSQNALKLGSQMAVTPEVAIDDAVRFIDGAPNASWLTSELVLSPNVKTYVGTDFAAFDYLLSIRPDYYLNIWKGAVLNARADIPVSWSENFENGRRFAGSRKSAQIDRLMLFQAIRLAPRVMLNLGAGMVLNDTYGTVNELMWTPGRGNHRFLLKHAYLSTSDRNAPYQKNSLYLGGYRYFYGPLDLYLEGTAGQYLDKDRGFSIELKRFFGDTAFSLYYKNSRTEATPFAASERVQVAGALISIPLSFRRDMKPSLLQVKGTSEWNYYQETKLVTPGEANWLDTSIGLDPQLAYNLERVFYNRDRLSEEYIRQHLLRLRDAYTTYRYR